MRGEQDRKEKKRRKRKFYYGVSGLAGLLCRFYWAKGGGTSVGNEGVKSPREENSFAQGKRKKGRK